MRTEYYTIKKRTHYIASRASYSAIDRYNKFAYFNLDMASYSCVQWVPGVMNQHGDIIELDLLIENSESPSKGFARFSDYVIIGLSGATALIFLAGVPILVVLVGLLLG